MDQSAAHLQFPPSLGLDTQLGFYRSDQNSFLASLQQQPHAEPPPNAGSFSKYISNPKPRSSNPMPTIFTPPFSAPAAAASPFSSSEPSSLDEQYPPFSFVQLPQQQSSIQQDQNMHPPPQVYALPPAPQLAGGSSSQQYQSNKRRRETPQVAEPAPSSRTMRLPGACENCKRLKMKCEFPKSGPNVDCCNRCANSNKECKVMGRRKPTGPNVRERLMKELREKNALIELLVKHVWDPAMQTPLVIKPNGLNPDSLTRTMTLPPSPPPSTSEDERLAVPAPQMGSRKDVVALLERMEHGNRHAGTSSTLGTASTGFVPAGAVMMSRLASKNHQSRGPPGYGKPAAQSGPYRTHQADDESDEGDSDGDGDQVGQADIEDDGSEFDSDDILSPTNGSPEEKKMRHRRLTHDSLPHDSTPIGLIAHISLSGHTPSLPAEIANQKIVKELGLGHPSENQDANHTESTNEQNVGIGNPIFFHAGPAQDLALRRIIIERQPPPEILEYEIVTPADVEQLFKIFFERINPSISLLDPVLHTPASTYARCPFLFTVICAISSRYYSAKPDLYRLAMQFARKGAASALIDGFKCIELCQSYILLGDYSPSARRWEEDRSWLFKGLAIRIATDLNLNQPASTKPLDEKHERELLNRTRTWLICFNLDRSASTQFGKSASLPSEDYVVRGSKNFYRSSKYNHPYDIHLCAYNQLLRLMTEFHEIVHDKAGMKVNKTIDYNSVTRIYDDRLSAFKDEWSARFAELSDPNDPGSQYRVYLMPFIVNYCKLVMHSIGLQNAFQKGLAPGDPFFLRCWNAATSVIKIMVEQIAPTGFLTYSPECYFIFVTFASGFLLKLLRPEFAFMVDADQRERILSWVVRLADVLDKAAIDNDHAPRLYSRFLKSLVAKHTRGAVKQEPAVTPTVLPTKLPQPDSARPSPGQSVTPQPVVHIVHNVEPEPPLPPPRAPPAVTVVSPPAVSTTPTPSTPLPSTPKAPVLQPSDILAQAFSPLAGSPITSVSTSASPSAAAFSPSFSHASAEFLADSPNMNSPQAFRFGADTQALMSSGGMDFDVDMDLPEDNYLAPMRAITGPVWNQHMLMPGFYSGDGVAVPASHAQDNLRTAHQPPIPTNIALDMDQELKQMLGISEHDSQTVMHHTQMAGFIGGAPSRDPWLGW